MAHSPALASVYGKFKVLMGIRDAIRPRIRKNIQRLGKMA